MLIFVFGFRCRLGKVGHTTAVPWIQSGQTFHTVPQHIFGVLGYSGRRDAAYSSDSEGARDMVG